MKDYARTAVTPCGKKLTGYTATRNGVLVGVRGRPIGTLSNTGYMRVTIRGMDMMIHRIIAATFHGENTHMVVDHIDGNKLNNKADNLRWVTQKINTKDGNTGRYGKLSPTPVRNIDTGKIYRSTTQAGKDVGVANASIQRAAKGLGRTAAGYRWEYYREDDAQLELAL
jgi:hypothetical protein